MQDYLFILLGTQAIIFILRCPRRPRYCQPPPSPQNQLYVPLQKRDQCQPFPNSTDCQTKHIAMLHGFWPSMYYEDNSMVVHLSGFCCFEGFFFSDWVKLYVLRRVAEILHRFRSSLQTTILPALKHLTLLSFDGRRHEAELLVSCDSNSFPSTVDDFSKPIS